MGVGESGVLASKGVLRGGKFELLIYCKITKTVNTFLRVYFCRVHFLSYGCRGGEEGDEGFSVYGVLRRGVGIGA